MKFFGSGYLCPILNIGASAACFLSIGVLFGFGRVSDSVFLILAIQSGFGAIAQTTWHAAIPLLYRKQTREARTVITSTVLINMVAVNSLYIIVSLLLENRYSVYFNGLGSGFYFFFQIHLFIKNSYLATGRLQRFYLIDVLGYLLSFCYFVFLSYQPHAKDNLVDLVFLGMLCSWLLVVLFDVYFHKDYLAPIYAQWFSIYCVRRGIQPRFASLLYSAKDFMIPIALGTFGGDGLVTIYSYANKVAISLYQVVPIHVVNQWFSAGRSRQEVFSTFSIKKLAVKAVFLYLLASIGAFCLLFLVVKVFSFGRVASLSNLLVMCIAVIVLILFGIQSYEQAYARAIYFLGAYNVQAKADFVNSAVFFLIFVFSIFFKNAIVALFGAVLSQLLSLWIYKKAVLRVSR